MARQPFAGQFGGHLQLEITSGWNRPNYEKNISVINIGVRIISDGYARVYGATQSSLKIKIDGQEVGSYTVDASIGPGQAIDLKSADFVVDHNSDGTPPPGYISAELNIGFSDYSWAAAGEYVHLQTIPRASSIKAQDGIIGQDINISIGRHSNTFKHAIRCSWYGKTTVIANNVDTNFTWTIPKEFGNDIPNSESGWGTLVVETYSGSNKIGEAYTTFTASISTDIIPTVNDIILSDTNDKVTSILGSSTDFVSILSNIRVGFDQPLGVYGSVITGYHAEIVEKNQSTNKNNGTLGIMDYTGSVTIKGYVIDSRGRMSNSIEKRINIIEYFNPIINFSIVRSGSDGSTLTITRNAKIAPLMINGIQKNKMTLKIKVALINSTDYVDDNGPASGTWTTISSLNDSQANLQGSYPANQSWKVMGILEDAFTTNPATFQDIVGTEKVVSAYSKNSFGFGKIPEKENAIDSAWNIYVNGSRLGLYGAYSETIYNIDTVLTAGIYAFNNDCVNQPNGIKGWGYLQVIVAGGSNDIPIHNNWDNWVWQTYSNTFGQVFERYKVNNNGWTQWVAPGVNQFYPVGSIYQSTESTSPATFMGGTWERFGNGRVIVGIDESDENFNTSQKTGGEKKHTLTIDEMPSHTHRQYVSANNGNDSIRKDWSADGKGMAYDQGMETGRTGGGKPHNNLQPYITLYRWRRIN